MIEPLRSLGNTASRIGTGDLSAPVDVRGASEINLLSQAMETMRQELEISRDELVQSAELLEQRVDQRTKELEALNQVSREIASRLELPQVLQSVAAKTIQLLGAEAVFLCLLDENGAQMRLQATLGPDGSIQASSTSAQAPPARSVLDSEAALSCGAGDCRGGCQIINPLYRNSHLVAPLKTGQHILGALCVGSRKLEAFTADSEALLFRLANIAAIAIENARLYAQAERAASLEERQCIAAEIHDGLAQTLSFLKLMAGQIALEVETGRIPEALNNLTRLDQALNLAVDDTRRAITSLQEHGPLREVLQDQISQLVEDFSSQYATSVEWLNAPTAPIVLSHQDNEQVLRIVQEALNNARQHSQATRIAICLDACGQDHIITVQDNGKGFDPEDIPLTNGRIHFGLKIMQARVARIGGSLDIRSEPGAGTEVRLTWPKMK
jgi:two-component system nitrate/nitrite sensor histidine kinase NarX